MAGNTTIAIFTNEGVLLNHFIEELADALADCKIEGGVKTTVILSGGSTIELEVRPRSKKINDDKVLYAAWSCSRGGREHIVIYNATQALIDNHVKNCKEPINEKGKED